MDVQNEILAIVNNTSPVSDGNRRTCLSSFAGVFSFFLFPPQTQVEMLVVPLANQGDTKPYPFAGQNAESGLAF